MTEHDQDIRLECLKMATETGAVSSEVERIARRFYDFVLGKEVNLSIVSQNKN